MNMNPVELYGDNNYTSKAPIIHEIKILLEQLKDFSKEERITLDQALKLYECKTNEYVSRLLFNCSNSLDDIKGLVEDK